MKLTHEQKQFLLHLKKNWLVLDNQNSNKTTIQRLNWIIVLNEYNERDKVFINNLIREYKKDAKHPIYEYHEKHQSWYMWYKGGQYGPYITKAAAEADGIVYYANDWLDENPAGKP